MKRKAKPCRCGERGRYCPQHQTFNVIAESEPRVAPVEVRVVRESNYGQCGGGRRVIRNDLQRAT